MSFSTIQFHPGPRVATIVLNRPPLNIINLEMLDELSAAWSDVEDLKAQVAVISGAGERAFSAGVEVADHAPGKIEAMLERFHRVILRIRKSDCVSIAAIHGHTLGGGAELAMMCDLIVAADDAQMGQPEISLGCYPPVAVAYLPGAVGLHKASEMVLVGEPVDAVDAERLGIINKVMPRDHLRGSRCIRRQAPYQKLGSACSRKEGAPRRRRPPFRKSTGSRARVVCPRPRQDRRYRGRHERLSGETAPCLEEPLTPRSIETM
ncbi:MAG: hypothetical protein DMG14_26865 [Acidobacteria bacterium]|nr:MAG: hypothetical protein DMG14_26865 [Acidobacteriota bacterium]